MPRILILGGTGVFGSRVARLLTKDARFDLVIASRSTEKAEIVATELSGPAMARAAAFDIGDIDQALKQVKPDLVIHCAGPFQDQDYSVAAASIAAGISYLDLSDGRAFSQGFSVLDEQAKAAGVFALTACSTTSALTTAAAQLLATGFSQVAEILVGVTPGNRAPRGGAVVKAILSYVGEPVPVWKNDEFTEITGWGELTRICLPGLSPRWFSPCDAPDITAMRMLFPDAHDITFTAGLELDVLHLPLWALAQVRRTRVIPNLSAASGLFHRAAQWFEPLGNDEGGMFVELAGVDANGAPIRRRWTLWAGSGDGPFIPAIGAAVIATRVANGDPPVPGARICAGEVALEEFEAAFSAFNIKTAIEEVE